MTFEDNVLYIEKRDAFLKQNEGFKTIVYFDTEGVATIATGVALITRKSSKIWIKHEENFKIFSDVFGKNSKMYQDLILFADRNIAAINTTVKPRYPFGNGEINAVNFSKTDRGQALVNEFGNIDNNWQVSISPKLITINADSITKAAISVREKELDKLLIKKFDIAEVSNISIEERVALLDTVYHYGAQSIIVKDGIKALSNENRDSKLAEVLSDKIFPSRSTAISNLLKTATTIIPSGLLAGNKMVRTTSVTGVKHYQLVLSDGTTVAGVVSSNDNVCFTVNGQIHILKNSNVVANIHANGSGTVVVARGDANHYSAGQISYDLSSGLLTTHSIFHAGGVKIDGLLVTASGSGGAGMTVTGCRPIAGTSLSGLLRIDQSLIAARENGADPALVSMCSRGVTQALVNGGKLHSLRRANFSFSPIGAFYESTSAGFDSAISIAGNTFRVLNRDGVGLTAAQLAVLDTNGDAQLSGTELHGLLAWSDLNEDGVLNQSMSTSNELSTLSAALTAIGLNSMCASAYAFYTTGNANYRSLAQTLASAPAHRLLAPSAVASHYAALRQSDHRFQVNYAIWIDWSASQIKLSSNQKNLVGTDSNDNFDINYYTFYHGKLFNLDLVQNFYAGAGNDAMGGSVRHDNLWGGTGNDVLFGYAGDDRLYGEEGNDEIQGGVGHDVLDGGSGDDKLFGQVGDDTLVGDDGNDIMMGFMASNDGQQTLAAGETDNDRLFGGNGSDQLWGGIGHDYMDGGADNDLVMGGDGNDTLFGGAGDDEINAASGNDLMDGGTGADKIFGGVGDDRMWGGDGDDIMMGFNPINDVKQTLAAGETDNDVMYGGSGADLMLGGLGDDQQWGGIGNDELQGGAGGDMLYGEDGNDRLFGGAGDDTIYGGNGDDLIVGGVGNNESALAADVSDNNFLYGGAGNDTLIGGIGNDLLDGGAGADIMEGGKGDDMYIVNSVNDVILEQQNEGYDTVIAHTHYLLNTGVEELHLTEGGAYNGTGNSLNNKIIGNSQDNILDGVTGADMMMGGLGNDTYYVDNPRDQVIEAVGEGIDTVNASISYSLGDQVENLMLLDFSRAEQGRVDGVNILVYGYPKAFELDYMQGNAIAGYKGTCALTAIANLGTQANQTLSEAEVVQTAIDQQWCVTEVNQTDYQRGGSHYIAQQALLDGYGIRNGIEMGYNEDAIANLIKGGRGVIIGVNAGTMWADKTYLDNGAVNHVVTVTGVACDAATGALNGFYIADSGRGKVSDMTRYVALADFRIDADVAGAYAIYTIDPIKLWEENMNATGNVLDNILMGNRGNNILTGGKGNDTLIGGAGNDTYVFAKGDGQDMIVDSDATAGNVDVLQLSNLNQNELWFRHVGDNLQIKVMGTTDQITIKDWYIAGVSGADNQIECVKTADGLTLYNSEVEQLVQALAGWVPPAAAEVNWGRGQHSHEQVSTAFSAGIADA